MATSTAYKEGSDIHKLVRGSVEASSALCQETCAHIYPVRITGSQATQLSHMHVQDLTLQSKQTPKTAPLCVLPHILHTTNRILESAKKTNQSVCADICLTTNNANTPQVFMQRKPCTSMMHIACIAASIPNRHRCCFCRPAETHRWQPRPG